MFYGVIKNKIGNFFIETRCSSVSEVAQHDHIAKPVLRGLFENRFCVISCM